MSDTFVTNVPQVVYGPAGVVVPTEDAVLTGVLADLATALGGNMDPGLTTPQGQIATSETAAIGDANATLAWLFSQFDPAQNSGRAQDAIGRLYFMTRIAAQSTVQGCICSGLPTTPIPVGALSSDPDTGIQWVCSQAGTIGVGGTVTLEFSSAITGPVAGPASLTIARSISGWESVVPTGSAVLGRNVESAAEYEQRRWDSVAANANQILDAIQGQVLAVPNVLDAYVTENDEPTAVTYRGVLLAPNSIYVCALGGTDPAVAFAMWSKKGPGCAYSGASSVVVTDPNPAYSPPAPTYVVRLQRPSIVSFAVLATVTNSAGVPANARALIQASVIAAFAGLDGGTRAKIGSTVYASRLYGGILALGTWAQIVSIKVGVMGGAGSALFTGSISGAVLTVTLITFGTLTAGQLLQDAGLIAQGTEIVAQLSGSPGSVGTYQVSVAQVLSSEVMSATMLLDDVALNVDIAPAVSALNIQLLLV